MRLRNEMDLFANLRPAICPPAADALDRAIADTLAQGLRTADIGQGGPAIGTHAIGGRDRVRAGPAARCASGCVSGWAPMSLLPNSRCHKARFRACPR
ncbi:hypothetical protein GCM10011614_33270 [Novosphingobium colocasiae]|uniref:Uncharacterized protein n=1 Tax=Novosphingobium colocasiae TaxID=1256513 RepID=A0A918PM22_9SPHN|nr:hypothetical protein GCM10011614_33270 [Novosphingobium colocasiae]